MGESIASPSRRIASRSVQLLKDGVDGSPTKVVRNLEDNLNISSEELVGFLTQTESLSEQAEIIHYLYFKEGRDWNTGIKIDEDDEEGVPVRILVDELFRKAVHSKKWWLVRHAAGMMDRSGEDLAKAISDLLVRQKQVTLGMPSDGEVTISRPLPPKELLKILNSAYTEDSSTAMLTQEILMYLSMYIRSEPKLFSDLLVLRIGLIIQVRKWLITGSSLLQPSAGHGYGIGPCNPLRRRRGDQRLA